MAHAPATEAQAKYIKTLLDQRQVPEHLTTINTQFLTKLGASVVIETLKSLPSKPRPQAAKPSGNPVSNALRAALPMSKYAVPFEELSAVIPGTRETTGHLFLEVKTFKGVTYMRRLHGAPGHFTRSRLNNTVVLELVKFMDGRAQEFSQEFGRLYTCCGSCGAELTDERSRELFLGPECRKKFGL